LFINMWLGRVLLISRVVDVYFNTANEQEGS
jgi:hypothetical protein